MGVYVCGSYRYVQYVVSQQPLQSVPSSHHRIHHRQRLIVALDLNRKSFNWILFRPRVMVDVDVVDTSTTMLGHKTSLPVSDPGHLVLHNLYQIFLCPTGMAGLAHPQGERLLSAGAGDCDAIYMVRISFRRDQENETELRYPQTHQHHWTKS